MIGWMAVAFAGRVELAPGEVDLGKKVDRVELTSINGAITIRGDAAADRPRLIGTDRIDNRMCDTVVVSEGATARVTFGPKSANQPEKCSRDFVLSVPDGLSFVRGVTANGPIVVEKTSGPVSFETALGDARLTGVIGPVEGRAPNGSVRLEENTGPLDLVLGTGDLRGDSPGPIKATVGLGAIELSGLTQPVDLATGRGRIVLAYDVVPIGTIKAQVANGSVAIDLPDRPTVRALLTATGANASTSCELPTDDAATTTVHAIADQGSVRVF